MFSKMRPYFAAAIFLGIVVAITGGIQFPVKAQTAAASDCLEISNMQPIAGQTIVISLRARVNGTTAGPVHGKLHIYTADSSTVLVVERTPDSAIFPSSGQADPQLHTVRPVVVQLPADASQVKGMVLETLSPASACAMSTFLPSPSPNPLTKEVLAIAKDTASETAPPLAPMHMECPVPFGYPHVLEYAQVPISNTAAQNRIAGQVQVLVSLAADGTVTDAQIRKSPSTFLNAGALQAARESRYAPQYVACVAVPAKYIFIVEYRG